MIDQEKGSTYINEMKFKVIAVANVEMTRRIDGYNRKYYQFITAQQDVSDKFFLYKNDDDYRNCDEIFRPVILKKLILLLFGFCGRTNIVFIFVGSLNHSKILNKTIITGILHVAVLIFHLTVNF